MALTATLDLQTDPWKLARRIIAEYQPSPHDSAATIRAISRHTTLIRHETQTLMSDDSKGKKSKGKKEAQLVIRLDKDLRDKFVAACQDVDTSASREIRRFMKNYLAHYERGDID